MVFKRLRHDEETSPCYRLIDPWVGSLRYMSCVDAARVACSVDPLGFHNRLERIERILLYD